MYCQFVAGSKKMDPILKMGLTTFGQSGHASVSAQTWWRFFWSGRRRKHIDSKHYVVHDSPSTVRDQKPLKSPVGIWSWFPSIRFLNKPYGTVWKGSWRQQEMGTLDWSWRKSETVLNVISYMELLLVSCDMSAHGSRTNTPTWRAGVCLLCCFCAKHRDWLWAENAT